MYAVTSSLIYGIPLSDGFPAIEEARMWTRADITQFKESARAGGGRLTVGHGETVTVRVPTHPRARCLCWEFATDNYDIGIISFLHNYDVLLTQNGHMAYGTEFTKNLELFS